MALPGPGGVGWGIELLLLAAATLPTGELLRRLSARYVRFFRPVAPLEVGILDLYLAGGAIYVVGEIAPSLFVPMTPLLLLLGGAIGLVVLVLLERRSPRRFRAPPAIAWHRLASPPMLAALAVAAGLYAVELGVAEGVPTGNTFDSSILAMFLGLTQSHHALPQSFAPIAAQATAYPQGLTGWLYTIQSMVALPVSRSPLLVTPLFLALGPLAAYVWAERWWESGAAGAIFALGFALLLAWTRVLVAGSNDFAAAFPLVLLLWAWLRDWTDDASLSWTDALGFGIVAGVSAAINPVGAQLLFVALPIFAWVARPGVVRRAGAWFSRWAISLGAAFLFVLPSLSVLWAGRGSPGLVAGGASAPGTPLPGLSTGQLVGLVDPFLFRPTDVWLSPFPVVRAELALLLVLGLGLLFLPGLRRRSAGDDRLRAFLPALFVAVGILLLGEWGAQLGFPGGRVLADITSAAEASILLFSVYGAACLLPVIRAAEAARAPSVPRNRTDEPGAPAAESTRALARWRRHRRPEALLALGLAALAFVPGAVTTSAELPGYLHQLYLAFGNTTAADFDLLEWGQSHLPAGARVLVAPGSSAQFLAGERPDIALLYPVAPIANNASYRGLVGELDRGNLSSSGRGDLTNLTVQYILVTQANTELWVPFSPAPLLAAPLEFLLQFHEGDAYAFAVAGSTGG